MKFHVNADLKHYTKEKIQDIVQVVADILRCKKEDIKIHSLEHSQSFILTLSIKKHYKWKMYDLSAEERQTLVSLDVDFLIVGKETLFLHRLKGKCCFFSYDICVIWHTIIRDSWVISLT